VAEQQRAVIWTPGAQTDLDEIVAYIARDSLPSARAFLEEAFETAETLTTLAERGRVVPELNDPIVRELFIKRYRLLYEVHEREIHVLAVLHGAREFKP
jgi:plasmid stabilization system protein ParE